MGFGSIIACDEGGLPLSDTEREYLDRTGRTEKQQREHHHSARDKVKEAEEVKKQ